MWPAARDGDTPTSPPQAPRPPAARARGGQAEPGSPRNSIAASRKAQEIYTQLDQLNTRYYNVDTKLRRLRSDVNLSGIFVRDYLLDVARERAPEYRAELARFRRTNIDTLAQLKDLLKHDEEVESLQSKLDEYSAKLAASEARSRTAGALPTSA